MKNKSHPLIRIVFALALAIFVVSGHAALSDKLRVLSCDLATLPIHESNAAFALKNLLDKADPDIVFLQGAIDWEACDRICKLRPGLRVLTCSVFSAALNAKASQVAILARDKAVLSWVEPVANGDGFAFALLQAGARKIGVFSVQSHDIAGTDRILAEVKKLQGFANNRPESFLVAGGALLASGLTQAGFETVPADASSKTVAAPELWTSNAGFLSRPRAIAVAGLPRLA